VNLVTGATGILGSHVVLELLRRNQPVTACRQKSSDVAQVKQLFAFYTADAEQLFQKIKWVEVDIRDLFSIEEALEGISTVYHCAGLVSFHKKDRHRLTEINEKGTANVVNACLHKKNMTLCHVSSIATINNSDYLQELNEEVFWKTSGRENDYAISKYNGEREVWRGMEEGLDALIVNPGVILSPGFWDQSSSRLFNACYKGNRFYTQGTSAYISAPDAAKAMVDLTTKRLFTNRYILIENNYSFYEVLNRIHKGLHKPAPSFKVPPLLLRLAIAFSGLAAFFSGRNARLTKAMMNAAFNRQLFSNKKLRETLDYQFTPIGETIEAICNYYLSQKLNSPSSP
jgi:dihydroflavonol-4-reductase